MSARWRDDAALTVVMAANGYPGTPQKGTAIAGVEVPRKRRRDFHAGTALKDGKLVANGGRVLNVTARARPSPRRGRAYEAVGRIDWPGGFFRRDIGWRAVEREKAG